MMSIMTSDLEVTINSLAESVNLHTNKLTAAVNSLSSASPNNLGKHGQGQPICENPDSENSELGKSTKSQLFMKMIGPYIRN